MHTWADKRMAYEEQDEHGHHWRQNACQGIFKNIRHSTKVKKSMPIAIKYHILPVWQQNAFSERVFLNKLSLMHNNLIYLI